MGILKETKFSNKQKRVSVKTAKIINIMKGEEKNNHE